MITEITANVFEPAHSSGARISSHSWGIDEKLFNLNALTGLQQSSAFLRQSIVPTRAVDTDTFSMQHPDHLVIFAAHNDGDAAASISPECASKNGLCIGATSNTRQSWQEGPLPHSRLSSDTTYLTEGSLAVFSSRGPTFDLRYKPDLVAPGFMVASAGSDGLLNSQNCDVKSLPGTSMATPLVAGLAAVARQLLRERYGVPRPSAALLKAVLINSADPRIVQSAHGAAEGSAADALRVGWPLPPGDVRSADPAVLISVESKTWASWPPGVLVKADWSAASDPVHIHVAPKHRRFMLLQFRSRRDLHVTITAGATPSAGVEADAFFLNADSLHETRLGPPPDDMSGDIALWITATPAGPALNNSRTPLADFLVNTMEFHGPLEATDRAVPTISCTTTGADLPLNYLGSTTNVITQAGLAHWPDRYDAIYAFKCPPSCARRDDLYVLGTDLYLRNSSLCGAALHRGMLGNPARPRRDTVIVMMRGIDQPGMSSAADPEASVTVPRAMQAPPSFCGFPGSTRCTVKAATS